MSKDGSGSVNGMSITSPSGNVLLLCAQMPLARFAKTLFMVSAFLDIKRAIRKRPQFSEHYFPNSALCREPSWHTLREPIALGFYLDSPIWTTQLTVCAPLLILREMGYA